MKRDILRACLLSAHFWALIGTPVPPLNVLYAFLFWLWCRLDRPLGRRESARCLNIQITYTLLFYLPLGLALLLPSFEGNDEQDLTAVALRHLAAGFPLGFLSLAGIVLLAVFNVRNFALAALALATAATPRLRIFPETFD